MSKLSKFRCCYLVLYVLYGSSVELYFNGEYLDDSIDLALAIFIFKLVFLGIRVYIHVYLLSMGFKTQQLFRFYGHIQGYWGEIVLLVCYVYFFAGNLLYMHVFEPLLAVLVNKVNFECSDSL